jgi:dipeptidyl aminopeptidase/acylaminoacyl peptidase
VWDRNAIAEPELLEVTASDGGVVPARWYRADDPAVPRRVIVWVHGGPTDQWQVTFMPRIEFWRSRGWDVVVPDHRGSTGHGRAHQQAMNGRWGELDVADVAAVIAHLHATGVTDPALTVLMGGSAGGFTALGVIARHPGLVAAAAVAYPVGDLADLAERSHRFERHSAWRLVGELGSPEVDRRYRDRSPVWFADRITTPLLVFHGEDDPVVPVGQSRVLVERIRIAGGPAELVVYPGAGHGFRQPDQQRDEYARTEAFLELRVTPRPQQG